VSPSSKSSKSSGPTNPRLGARLLEDAPRLLDASYRLRFNVFCLERQFLEASQYPDEMETDEFDEHAVHLGAVDERDHLVGTARLILRSPLGLPMFRHCLIGAEFAAAASLPSAAEISRLSVSRDPRRHAAPPGPGSEAGELGDRARPGEVMMTLAKVVYQASKGLGVTHWLAAIEKSLHRILTRMGLPFEQIGPEADYLGMVAPYMLVLADLDAIVAKGDNPAFHGFNQGLDSTVSAMERSLADGYWHMVGGGDTERINESCGT
jgi:N-acyl amino acid synthase of PEP-CTERM/exosortase system